MSEKSIKKVTTGIKKETKSAKKAPVPHTSRASSDDATVSREEPVSDYACVHLPQEETNESERVSLLAGLYEEWNNLATLDVSTPAGLFAVIKKLAKISQGRYLYSPAALPKAAWVKMKELLRGENLPALNAADAEWRRKTIRQFKFYLNNQFRYSHPIHKDASEKWGDALALLKAEVALMGTRKMYLTQYSQDTVDGIMERITEASRLTWVKYQLKASLCDQPKRSGMSATAKMWNKRSKFKWNDVQARAYDASLTVEPIVLSPYAVRLGVKCSPAEGLIEIGDERFIIKRTSIMAWMVIRLLLTAKTGEALLFRGWAGAFSGTDENKTRFRHWIQRMAKTKNDNNLKFRLAPPQK